MSSHFIFENPGALKAYSEGEAPSIDVIRRGMFVEDWRDNPFTPDHFLKNRRDFVIGQPGDTGGPLRGTLGKILFDVLEYLYSRYLIWQHDRLFVYEALFGEWQDLLANVSPLVLMAYSVYRHAGLLPTHTPHRKAYVDRWLIPNFHSTALPYPANPLMSGLIRREGLIEIHCHLSGSTESDYVWLDAVAHPSKFYRNINSAWQGRGMEGEYVREQFEQIELGLTPLRVWQRLRSVRNLRRLVCNQLYLGYAFAEPDELKPGQFITRPLTLAMVSNVAGRFTERQYWWNTPNHPAADYLRSPDPYDELVLEASFLIQLFHGLDERGDYALAHALYFHLLTNTQIIKLVVQQVKQFGFDQFQKITFNEARTFSEEDYTRRFHQMDASAAGDIRYFEGRIAPKSSPYAIRALLAKVEKGFQKFKKDQPAKRMELGLVCHFIKRPEDASPAGCRHHRLRNGLMKSGRSLIQACRALEESKNTNRVVGADAASNELQAPPEIFAPLYRYLRREGLHQFTYHVGEDFVHLLSGIRAIYEAVEFLNLCPGDRIGHGTAIGIEPELWRDRIGDTVYIGQGELLDNLVFAYHRFLEMPNYHHLISRLEDRVAELSRAVYGSVFSPQALHTAWTFRPVDPLIAFNPARQQHILNPREREEELHLIERMADHDEARYLYRYYHGQVLPLATYLEQWNKIEMVSTDFLPFKALRQLQEDLLSRLVTQSIAIESMPVSNLRIGFYHDLAEHHIFRWLGVSKNDGVRPLVCVGSDDPGIFATSIRAEFLHLYRVLVRTYQKTPTDAINILEGLLKNAEAFQFSPVKMPP